VVTAVCRAVCRVEIRSFSPGINPAWVTDAGFPHNPDRKTTPASATKHTETQVTERNL
jgi:hypothetical protein